MSENFDRDYAKDILDKRLEAFMKEFDADISLNETNIHDKTVSRSSLAAKWCRYEYEEKKYKQKIEDKINALKQYTANELFKKKKDSIVNQKASAMLMKADAEACLKSSSQYNSLKEELNAQEDILRFIGEAKQIISQFGFDIKNSIEILKLEQI